MIPKKLYYLSSLFFVFIIPAIICAYFTVDRIPLANLVTFVLGITFLGSLWDIWATKHGKRDQIWLWQFNSRETLGIKILDLPIEEYLFYVASSLYIVFIWEGIKFTLETESTLLYILLPLLGIWSLLFLAIPFFVKTKNDRL